MIMVQKQNGSRMTVLIGLFLLLSLSIGVSAVGQRPLANGESEWNDLEQERDGLEYFSSGTGPALLVLPGAAGMDVRVYKQILYPLEESLQVIYVNPGGAGQSEPPENGHFSMDVLTSDLEMLRLRLDISEWYLLGHGYGSQVALQYSLAYPDAVAGLILSGGAHYLGDEWFFQRQEATKLHPAYEEYVDLPTLEHNSDDAILMLDFYDAEGNQELVQWLQPYLDVCLDANAFFMEQYWSDFDIRGQLGPLKVSVLLLWGRYDVVDPVERAEELQAELPQAELIIFEEAAFWALLEQRHAFLEAVLDFVR